MWESKAESIDVNYNLEHVWFDGINGQHVQKPADIRKWEESKVYKLIEKNFPRVKADKMLTDLSSIALEWAKNYVRQRQTFKLNIYSTRTHSQVASQADDIHDGSLIRFEGRGHISRSRLWLPIRPQPCQIPLADRMRRLEKLRSWQIICKLSRCFPLSVGTK